MYLYGPKPRPVCKDSKHRKLKKKRLIYVYVSACMFVCALCACVSGARRGQKRVPDPWELELQALMRHLWVLGTEPGSSKRAANVHNC